MRITTKFLTAAFLLAMFTSFASAGEWASRAHQMNRREISSEEAKSASSGEEVDRRNKLCMRRIKPAMKGPDWDADPTGIPYAMYQVNKRTELPVHIDNEGLDVASDALFEETIIYLTSHSRWAFNAAEMENLSRWLTRGGTILLDDCYLRGSGFTESKNTEVAKIMPGIEGPIFAFDDTPVGHDMFSLLYANAPRPETIRERHVWEYFMYDDRPMVFFTMNDDGCAWEVSTPPTASNPIGEGIGHGGDNTFRELTYQWLSSWFLYAMCH